MIKLPPCPPWKFILTWHGSWNLYGYGFLRVIIDSITGEQKCGYTTNREVK